MIEKINDQKLHLETIKAAKEEKLATLKLLEHLEEVSRRKLYADFGYSTLQKYMMKELGYSENESWTRIQTMRLIAVSPVAKEKIESNELSFTNAAIIQSQVTDEKTPPNKIDDKVKESLGKSARDLKEESKPKTEKKIILNERILSKIKKLGWESTELEVFEALLDEKLKQQSEKSGHADESKVSRYIPVETKRAVLKRSGHKCEHPKCTERRNLQWDHIKPYAMGGDRSPENIRLLCWAHNQRRAFKTFKLIHTSRGRPPSRTVE